MTKKKIVKLRFLILFLGGLLAYFVLNKKDQNQIIVTVDNSISLDKIQIDQGFYFVDEVSDENLIKKGLEKVIYRDSKATNIETICGENDFLVVYNNEYYTIMRHFIPNDFYDGIPKPHTYNFDFKRKGGKINLTLSIEGENDEQFNKVMVKIADADNNIWGSQKVEK
ncbi:MAG: hypothetical protein JJT94_06505 [Bernardetiaceae bacterium]|nr:hypothetical protein [Bernardetiaceae bacterium]